MKNIGKCVKILFLHENALNLEEAQGNGNVKGLGSVQTDNTDRYAHWVLFLDGMYNEI